LLSVKDPKYKIPSLELGLIDRLFPPSAAVFTNVNTFPIAIAGSVNTTSVVFDKNVFPESVEITTV